MGDETKVQMREVAKGVEAVGGIVERYMVRFLGPLGRKIAAATKTGRIMALLGVATIIVSLSLIIFDNSISMRTVARKKTEFVVVTYEKKGYGIPFLAGIGLLVVGIMQKQHRR